jgi:hypothetical protein
VVQCYWLLPVRPDQPLRPLDLKRSGWPRSARTDSVSGSTRSIRSRSDGAGQLGFWPAGVQTAGYPNLGGTMSVSAVPSATWGTRTRGLYLRAPEVEVVSVARLQRRRWVSTAGIARRRILCGQWLWVMDVLLEPGCKRAPKQVSEVHGEKKGRIEPERGLGVVGAHWNRR